MVVDDPRDAQWRILAARFVADAGVIDNLCERGAAPPRDRVVDTIESMALVSARWHTIVTRIAATYRDALPATALPLLDELATHLHAVTTTLGRLPDALDPARAARARGPNPSARGSD